MAINYTPRPHKRKVVEVQNRAVFDKPVQKQRQPIYKVESLGVCIEFTDRLNSALEAYKEGAKPKVMWKMDHGVITKLYQEYI